jgi:hypothetical protein
MNRLLVLVATITLAGCARPGDYPISSNCIWEEKDSRSLNLTKISDRRHLRFDWVGGFATIPSLEVPAGCFRRPRLTLPSSASENIGHRAGLADRFIEELLAVPR